MVASIVSVPTPANAAAAPAAQTWTQTGTFDHLRGWIVDISCPSDSFCAANDDGRVATYDGTSWQPVVGVDNGKGLTAISCASATFCVVTNNSGGIHTYNGTSWSDVEMIDAGHSLVDVSCPLATWCMALDSTGRALSFDGTDWSTPQPTGVSNATALSCNSPDQCLAGGKGTAVWGGTSWTLDASAPKHAPVDIDCFAATTCVVAFTTGATWFRSNGTWSIMPRNNIGARGVACLSMTSCFAVTPSTVLSWDGTQWGGDGALSSNPETLTAIACGSSDCFATDMRGLVWRMDAGAWGAAQVAIVPHYESDDISCATKSFCVTVDDVGAVKTWDGTHWADPVAVDVGGVPLVSRGVSCPSTTFCMLVGPNGDASTFDGHSWSALVDAAAPIPQSGRHDLAPVSCASASFCLALQSAQGAAVRWNGSTWQLAGYLPQADDVSCPSATFCLTTVARRWNGTGFVREPMPAVMTSVSCASEAVCLGATDGKVAFRRNGTWGPMRTLFTAGVPAFASCATTAFCEVVDATGVARSYTHDGWSAPQTIDPSPATDPVVGLSCPAVNTCVALTAEAAYETTPA